MDEDIVVGRVADAAADNTDRKSEGGNGSNEVLNSDENELNHQGTLIEMETAEDWNAELTSGQIIVVMIDAGTTMPPIPSPAITNNPHRT